MPRSGPALACLLVGLLAASVGGAVLYGWARDIEILKSLLPIWVSMKPNTALAFTLAGLALALAPFAASPLTDRLCRLLILATGLIGLLTLTEDLLDWNPGFDLWLFIEPAGTVGTLHPGRMAPDTALCFLLLSPALLLTLGQGKMAARLSGVTMGLLVAIIGLIELFSHFTRPIEAYGLWGTTVMAVHTALLFVGLGLTVAGRAWPKGLSVWSLPGRTIISATVWTLLLGGSLAWSLQNEWHRVVDSAADSARASIRKDISFRKWATAHGGVYVKPTAQTPPNPYLRNQPDRDLLTTTGLSLTLMNPAYMLREMQSNFSGDFGIRSHLTSLKPLNPNNAPDPWEYQVLVSFEQVGPREYAEVQQIDGQPYLRMMMPFIVEAGCLKCHADQGYQLGDVRGGIGSSIPLAALLAKQQAASTRLSWAYGIIWLLGLVGLALFNRREHQLASENEQERAFSTAVINSLPGVFYAYEDGVRLVRWNKNLETVSGYGAEELRDRHPLAWFVGQERERVAAALDTAKKEEVKIDCEVVFKEQTVPYYLTGSWLVLGKKRYLIGVGVDLSERKKLEEGLRQAQKMESIGTLAGGIAHDFNNILSAIIGYNDLALTQVEENRPCLDELAEVRKAAKRAALLVQQILTISRRQSSEKSPLLISLIVKEALKLLRASIPSTIEIRPEIVATTAMVMADATQIHQVIMNLCTNAYQAMAERGGVLTVSLEEIVTRERMVDGAAELPAGRYVLLTVSDTGPGMTREVMERIFDPYFTTKAAGKGTGLGLAVVLGIVKDHQGRVAVYSEPDHGATFKVYLPAIATAAAPVESAEPVAPRAGAVHERVMLVDDENAIRGFMARMLTEAGYRVECFADGLAAWQAFSASPGAWDALITDQTMPGLTGDQLADRVAKLRPDLPVILCSGYSTILTDDAGKKARVAAFLEKPVSRVALLTQLAQVLEGKKSA